MYILYMELSKPSIKTQKQLTSFICNRQQRSGISLLLLLSVYLIQFHSGILVRLDSMSKQTNIQKYNGRHSKPHYNIVYLNINKSQ